MVMQMFFNGANGAQSIPTKSDDLDNNGLAPSPWANIISVGLKIVTALLGGGANNDGIDKVDNGNSPMQVRKDFILTNHSCLVEEKQNLLRGRMYEYNVIFNQLKTLKAF
jgi:hypothetical protein